MGRLIILAGPKGAKGAQGPPGPMGPEPPAGPPGPKYGFSSVSPLYLKGSAGVLKVHRDLLDQWVSRERQVQMRLRQHRCRAR